MNKTAIKNFAIWSRVTLIEAVKQKAYEYGITADGYGDISAISVNGRLLTPAEQKQRGALIAQIKQKGFEQVMEESAYTWFNRFIALRYMEVNNFLPTKIRVFSDENDEFNPEILKEAMTVELDGINKDKIYDYIEKQDNENLYKYLLIAQCNALGGCLPGMFEKIEDYTELLFPNNLLKSGSVLDKMVTEIPTEDWEDIEIIGWMYQYYISEKHEAVVDPLHGKIVKKEDIPAATQLFTTKWVVQYVVDNSLGRYWIERHPESNLAEQLEFLVKPKSGEFLTIDEPVKPEDLKILDPCCGSGHFLVYAFDVLLAIYIECGYSERDAAKEIIENNLYGLDIDDRAGQLAYFAVMMKARKYNRRILNGEIKPNVMSIQESNNFNSDYLSLFGELKEKAAALLDNMQDAKELGSIIKIKLTVEELKALEAKAEEIKNNYYDNFFDNARQAGIVTEFIPLVKQSIILAQKYDVVVTNPPFLNKMDSILKKFVENNYKDYKADLFSVFIYRNFDFCKLNGYSGFMSPFVWMFIKSYEPLRTYILSEKSFISLIQMEYSAFEEATVPVCSFILKNGLETSKGLYFKLSDFKGGMEVQKQKVLEAIKNPDCGYFYEAKEENFSKIPGSPIAYWVSEKYYNLFTYPSSDSVIDLREGIHTGKNELYLRMWFEISFIDMVIDAKNYNEIDNKGRWIPYSKGGSYRKWYGNNELVIGFDKIYRERMAKENGHVRPSQSLYFKQGATWSALSSGSFGLRLHPEGHLFDSKGQVAIGEKYLEIMGLFNLKVYQNIADMIMPTLDYKCGDVKKLPYCKIESASFFEYVNSNISLSKSDWDSFETSWDFKKHPLV